MVRAGFKLYDLVGRSRNAGVLPELHLPKCRLESAAATRRFFPGIAEKGLSGGGIWYDYQTIHPDRLTWTVALAGHRAGVVMANYVEAVSPLRDANGIAGVSAHDTITGDMFDIRARSVVLAAGSGLEALHNRFGVTGAPPLVRAMNLLLDRPAKDIALAGPSAQGRMLTAVPWAGGVLVGTYQADGTVPGDEKAGPDPFVDAFIEEARSAFPGLGIERRDVRFVHHGLVPGQQGSRGFDLLADPRVVVHQELAGVISLVGVKYTTARLAAERTVDAVATRLGVSLRPCRTASTVLPHADVADSDGLLQETSRALGISLDKDIHTHLGSWYGTEAPAVLQCAHAQSALARLGADRPVIEGEVIYAVREAAAQRLEDVVFRRTPLGSSGHPGAAAVERAAAIMARESGWSDARKSEELVLVRDRFPN
jgi:glycerol-3-phosphate dehydrogenase